jgi:hypothetical protein
MGFSVSCMRASIEIFVATPTVKKIPFLTLPNLLVLAALRVQFHPILQPILPFSMVFVFPKLFLNMGFSVSCMRASIEIFVATPTVKKIPFLTLPNLLVLAALPVQFHPILQPILPFSMVFVFPKLFLTMGFSVSCMRASIEIFVATPTVKKIPFLTLPNLLVLAALRVQFHPILQPILPFSILFAFPKLFLTMGFSVSCMQASIEIFVATPTVKKIFEEISFRALPVF